jgi:hypothetical protein
VTKLVAVNISVFDIYLLLFVPTKSKIKDCWKVVRLKQNEDGLIFAKFKQFLKPSFSFDSIRFLLLKI